MSLLFRKMFRRLRFWLWNKLSEEFVVDNERVYRAGERIEKGNLVYIKPQKKLATFIEDKPD